MNTKQESGKFLSKQRSFQSNHFLYVFFAGAFPFECLWGMFIWKDAVGVMPARTIWGLGLSFSLVALWLPKEKALCKVALMLRMAGTNKKQMVEGLYWRDSNCRHIWSENVAIKRILRTSPVSYLSTQKVKQEKGRGQQILGFVLGILLIVLSDTVASQKVSVHLKCSEEIYLNPFTQHERPFRLTDILPH